MQNLTLAFGDIISKFTGNGSFIISVDAFKYALEALGSIILIKSIYSTVNALGDLYAVVKKPVNVLKSLLTSFITPRVLVILEASFTTFA